MDRKPSEFGPGIYKMGQYFWIKFYVNGKATWENSKTDKVSEARKLRNFRLGELAQGKIPNIHAERVTFEDLAKNLIDEYLMNKRKSAERMKFSVQHLTNFFKNYRAINVTTDKIREYIRKRQEAGVEDSTINRELAALKRMFNLASKSTPPKVLYVPNIPKLKENNARQGFFTQEQFLALRKKLPNYLKPVVTLAFFTGMRKGEILNLQWDQADLMEGKIILHPEDTKNSQGRAIFLNQELMGLLTFQRTERDQKFPNCDWVFFGETGEKIKDFRGAWESACQKANLPDKLFHDFRRSAIRNMVRSGTPETVAMRISGHKTRSVFDRYNIVSEDDLKKASQRVTEFLTPKEKVVNGSQRTVKNEEIEIPQSEITH